MDEASEDLPREPDDLGRGAAGGLDGPPHADVGDDASVGPVASVGPDHRVGADETSVLHHAPERQPVDESAAVEQTDKQTDELADVLPRDRFRQLLSRVADGDNEASAELVSEYGGHILKAVRRRMNRSLRDRFDSQDFEQAVWASFFGHISVVQRIDSSGELAGFLTRMARNKVIDAGRRTQTRRESNGASSDLPAVEKDNRRHYSEPTPSQFAVANESWDRLNIDEPETAREMLRLKVNGATQAEIAEQMGVSDRHVRRILRRISRKQ